MNEELEKLQAFIDPLTEAFTRMAEFLKKVIQIINAAVPKLIEALEKAYDDKVLMETFGTTDHILIVQTLNRGFRKIKENQ